MWFVLSRECGLYIGRAGAPSTDPLPLTSDYRSPLSQLTKTGSKKAPPTKVVPLPPQAITARHRQISADWRGQLSILGPQHLPVLIPLANLPTKKSPEEILSFNLIWRHCPFDVAVVCTGVLKMWSTLCSAIVPVLLLWTCGVGWVKISKLVCWIMFNSAP